MKTFLNLRYPMSNHNMKLAASTYAQERYLFPFFFITLLALALIIAFPPIATWLPELMLK